MADDIKRTVRMLTLDEIRAQRAAKPEPKKPSVTITRSPMGDMTIVKFTTKPDAGIRARLLAADFMWSYASRKWIHIETLTEEQVYKIIRGY